jgi:hypothetical protein
MIIVICGLFEIICYAYVFVVLTKYSKFQKEQNRKLLEWHTQQRS